MAQVTMRDQSRAGHVLGGAVVEGLPARTTLAELVRVRVHHEVATHNADPGPVYRGLVAPEDAIRHTDGFRMPSTRPLDADRFVRAVHEAVAAGVVHFRIDGRTHDDLAASFDADEVDEVVVVMDRPIVARTR